MLSLEVLHLLGDLYDILLYDILLYDILEARDVEQRVALTNARPGTGSRTSRSGSHSDQMSVWTLLRWHMQSTWSRPYPWIPAITLSTSAGADDKLW